MIIDHIATVAFFIFIAGVFVGLGVSLYDRAERRQAVVDVLTATARCETAARISTAKESKAHEHANAAMHATSEAKRILQLVEGLHDCIKGESPDARSERDKQNAIWRAEMDARPMPPDAAFHGEEPIRE